MKVFAVGKCRVCKELGDSRSPLQACGDKLRENDKKGCGNEN